MTSLVLTAIDNDRAVPLRFRSGKRLEP